MNQTKESTQAEVKLKLNSIDFSNMEQTLTFVKRMVASMWMRFHPNKKDSIEDLAWDCYTHFVIKKYFERYDENAAYKKTNKMFFIKIGVRNYLIDQERRETRRIKTVSGDMMVGEGTSLFNMIDEKISDDVMTRVSAEEVVELLKGEMEWGKEHETPCLGVTKVSHHAVMVHYVKGYKPKEISSIFTLSVNRVNAIIRESMTMLIDKVKEEELELSY